MKRILALLLAALTVFCVLPAFAEETAAQIEDRRVYTFPQGTDEEDWATNVLVKVLFTTGELSRLVKNDDGTMQRLLLESPDKFIESINTAWSSEVWVWGLIPAVFSEEYKSASEEDKDGIIEKQIAESVEKSLLLWYQNYTAEVIDLDGRRCVLLSFAMRDVYDIYSAVYAAIVCGDDGLLYYTLEKDYKGRYVLTTPEGWGIGSNTVYYGEVENSREAFLAAVAEQVNK